MTTNELTVTGTACPLCHGSTWTKTAGHNLTCSCGKFTVSQSDMLRSVMKQLGFVETEDRTSEPDMAHVMVFTEPRTGYFMLLCLQYYGPEERLIINCPDETEFHYLKRTLAEMLPGIYCCYFTQD